MTAFGPLRTFVAWSALALAWAWAWALALARVAACAARRGLILERSGAERADCPVVLARGSGRRTHCVHFVLSVRTTAAKMMTKCAARTDPRAPLLGAPEIAPAGLRLPRRWVFGVREVGVRTSPHSTMHAGATDGCTGRLKAVAHAAESRGRPWGQVLFCNVAMQDLTPSDSCRNARPDPLRLGAPNTPAAERTDHVSRRGKGGARRAGDTSGGTWSALSARQQRPPVPDPRSQAKPECAQPTRP